MGKVKSARKALLLLSNIELHLAVEILQQTLRHRIQRFKDIPGGIVKEEA